MAHWDCPCPSAPRRIVGIIVGVPLVVWLANRWSANDDPRSRVYERAMRRAGGVIALVGLVGVPRRLAHLAVAQRHNPVNLGLHA